ncbi:ExeM/NucH family extracellular endonuclease [Gallaecimonas sp. GXIMD1310]|uniref:ExeM/NucH family extracellular endonuclease n=1 Tax=Gallaecimonas sp. GXIMD1310 TaxID=3131926 RepID=UPI003252FA63
MFNKKALLVTLALVSPSTLADLVISEYVEGSSYNKAVEITNTGDSAITLDGTDLAVYFNGATTTTARIPLTGSLAAGQSLVLANPRADASIKADISSGNINFNGDDAVALERDGQVLDLVGIIGTDPGSAYTDGGKSTKDMTLRRIPGSVAGSFDFSQWQAFAKDTFDGLGCAGVSACGSSTEPPPVAWQCPANITPIPAIQGSGDRSPLVPAGSYQSADKVVTEGRVTQVTTGLYKGFFLQDGAGDGNPATSDGIFVFTGSAPDPSIKPGASVCVEGLVKEYYGFTEVAMDRYAFTADDLPAVHTTDLVIGDNVAQSLEAVEGMKVRLTADSDMRVTRPFSYDYSASRSNMELAHGGPLYQPTQLFPALTSQASELAAANQARTLYVETDQKAPNGVIPYFPGLDAQQGYIRVNDRVENLEGVIGYSYSNYRLVADNQITAADFVHLSDRSSAPAITAKGQLRVASFNIENFFNTAVGGAPNPLGQNRGATTAADFALQQQKTVNALLKIDADVVGLVEVENNGFGDDSAIHSLLSALNAELPADKQYAVVTPAEAGTVGGDAITSMIIYRPSTVTPVGPLDILQMPNQITVAADGSEDIHHGGRPSLLQSFKRVFDGQATGDSFRVAINHLRSKGSKCAEDLEGKPQDGQGSCNELRNSEAALVAEHVLASDTPTLVLGDFNAYTSEDPILVMTQIPPLDRTLKTAHDTYFGDTTAAPQLDGPARVISQGYGLVSLVNKDSYSYQYDGMIGRLDQALATANMADKVAQVTDWHINAAESNLFHYDSRYTGDLVKSDNPFSASDHDPVVIELKWPLPGQLVAQTQALTLKESAGSGQLMVRRVGGVDGSLHLTAQLRFFGHSRHGHFYADRRDIRLENHELSFADGEGGEKAINLTVLMDRRHERPEKAELVLTDEQGQQQVVALTIVDDTRPRPPWAHFWRWLSHFWH